jgi:hypothetical protein
LVDRYPPFFGGAASSSGPTVPFAIEDGIVESEKTTTIVEIELEG